MSNEKQIPSVVLGERYAQAVAYASQLHATQARKSTTIPYISHLLGVSSLVLEAGGDEDMAIAALLHDGPEDQGGQAVLDEIRALFGERVAHMVEGCTDSLAENPEQKKPWRMRKEQYLAHLDTADDDSLTVSLTDKLHNARAIVSDLLITGPGMWSRFNATPTDILWYYTRILQLAESRNANVFLVTNLREAVNEMRRMTPPPLDARTDDISQYAMTYNAYDRWYSDLGTLGTMLQPLQAEYEQTGEIPEGAGVDALRAWLFGLIRSARFTSGLAASSPGVFIMTDAPENPAVRKILAALNLASAKSNNH